MKRSFQRGMAVLLSVLLVVSMFAGYVPTAAAETGDRHISFSYERTDGNYEGWNLWVWGTGVKDDQIDFTEVKDGKAYATIQVSEQADRVGFIVRKGNWEAKDGENDRYITLNKSEPITKVQIKSGQEEFFQVPEVNGPVINDGNAHFFFRDKELYAADEMHKVEKVELSILGDKYEMLAERENERFTYTLNDLPAGEHEYTYFVTVDGQTTEVTDPYNTVDGKSVITYLVSEIDVTATTQPPTVDYNQNAVVTVDLGTEEDANIRELSINLSEIGGKEKVNIDPELQELTVAVNQSVTAGVKILPITAIDEFGNRHVGEATLEVKARTFTGEEADFDWDAAVVYFMLTDRFFDGDSSNNDPHGIGYDTSKPGTYQGGDFKGITQKLDYLDELGINTIWINPIVDNIKYDVRYADPGTPYYGYHGYWADNFGELNPHFGSMADFHELIDQAHARGIKIMVDVVLNHTGYGLKEGDSSSVANFPSNEDRARFAGMLRAGGTDTVRGELAGLPDFITEDPAVREQIVEWQTDWIEKSRTVNGNTIDYFRVDTVKHVENTTWMAFKNALTKEMPEFKLIGESWGANVNDDQGYLNTGMMDSLLDFEFKNYARDFANGQLEAVHSKLENRNSKLSNTATLGQFLGSHDEDRFLELVGGDLGKYQVGASLQLTAKGQPVIYYGEELGLPGKNNYPQYDNRPNMPWDEVEGNEILDHYKKVLAFRNENPNTFAKGDRKKVAGSDSDKYLLFSRGYGENTVYVGLNTAAAEKEVTLNFGSADAVVTDHYSGKEYQASEDGKVTFTIPALEDGGTALLAVENGGVPVEDEPSEPGEIAENTLRIHYQRTDNSYANLGVWLWGDVAAPSENWPTGGTPFEAGNVTDYGAYVDVELKSDAQKIGFLVLNTTNGDKDGGDKEVEIISPEMNEIWIKQGSDEVFLYEPVDLPADTVRIHYDRKNNDYDGWGLWNWHDVAAPSDGWPNGAADAAGVGKYGAYYDIKLTEDAEKIGFLFVNKQTGAQTGDMSFDMLKQYNQLFVKEGEDKVFTNPYGTVPLTLISGEVLSDKLMTLTFSRTDGLVAEELADQLEIKDVDGSDVAFDKVTIEGERQVHVHGTFDLEKIPYSLTYGDRTITVRSGWRLIDEIYGYDGKLGAQLHEDGSATLKIWSPKADDVSVVLYDKDDQNIVVDTVAMTKGDRGVWSVKLSDDNTGLESLRGYYYHYEITHGDETKLALDPYASSMAAWNSKSGDPIGKAAIVDISSIGPDLEYATIPGYEKREDAIIYEVHVRDFTSDPNIADDLTAQFGTFASFVEKLDYIQDLGVTHVQLLPVMSYFFADEFNNGERMLDYASTNTNYNWGYDPQSYFSLTGMYSENPEDPELRIKEFKNLIDEIHSRDMGVVLDVVYNHTAQVSIFEDLVPNYYHFMDADGTPRTSFGGGRLGTTHKMARRVLVDSIKHWVDEYKVDGFRFDMMGDHDAESIQMAFDEAKKLNPNIVMIGEGWVTFAGDEGEPVQAADQQWMQYTEAVGSFSDEFRNELKSGFGSEGQPRFITGGARNVQQIFDNIKAQPHNFVADQPGDVVQYIEAHDNLTVYDVIAQSIKKDPELPENDLEIHKRIRIGNAMVLTSQGTAFLHAGQEFGRTKQWRAPASSAPYKSTYMTDENGNPFAYPYFIHDSYDSSDIINRIDWEKATNAEAYPVNHVTSEYTKGLIELRRSTDAFRLGSKELADEKVTMITAPEIKEQDLVVAYRSESTDGEAYYVFVNADTKARTLTLAEDLTEGVVVVDQDEAGVVEVSERSGFELTAEGIVMEPLTTVVVKIGGEGDGTDPGDGDGDGDGNTPPGNGNNPGKGNGNGNNPGNGGTTPPGKGGETPGNGKTPPAKGNKTRDGSVGTGPLTQ